MPLENGKFKQKRNTTTHLLELAKSTRLKTSAAAEQQEFSVSADENAGWNSHFEDKLALSYQIKLLLYDPVITLGIYANELKCHVQTKTHPRMCIGALSIIATTWKQPRCPSVREWTHKLVHIDNAV